jgi:hypothetical protein
MLPGVSQFIDGGNTGLVHEALNFLAKAIGSIVFGSQ